MNQELGKKLLSILKEEQVKKDEPMKSHTTFRVGGPADYFVTPQTAEEVAKVIEACTQEKVPYYIVGNGSNLLVSDKGYEGVIIQIYKQMNQVKVEGAQIHAQAGALLSMIATERWMQNLPDLNSRQEFRERSAELCNECRSVRRRDERRAEVCNSTDR